MIVVAVNDSDDVFTVGDLSSDCGRDEWRRPFYSLVNLYPAPPLQINRVWGLKTQTREG